jgi:hypothetical protein
MSALPSARSRRIARIAADLRVSLIRFTHAPIA